MSHWKLTLSYDGTAYNGWQVQPGLPTIQGTLQHAIASITDVPLADIPLPQGSGRTDSGVHALGQVVSFSLSVPIPAENLLHALNRALPPAIRVLSAQPVPHTFHARHSVLRKSYEYRIFERRPPITTTPGALTSEPGAPFMDSSIVHGWGNNAKPTLESGAPFMDSSTVHGWGNNAKPATAPDRICPPFLAPYVWDCRWPLALEPMQQATALLIGTHDFTSFAAHDPDLTERTSATSGPNPIKTIHTSTLTLEQGLLVYRITGSGFLHHMVRNIVGTLTDIGRGALAPTDIPRILAARDRSAAGPTAPAQGLYLVQVDYPATSPPDGTA